MVLSLTGSDWRLVGQKLLHMGLELGCVVLRFQAVVAGYLLLDHLAIGCDNWLALIGLEVLLACWLATG